MSSTLVVITGGPGSGKTTLIEAFAAAGYAVAAEAGRAIIRDHTAIDGPALPNRDPVLFRELVLAADMRAHTDAQQRAELVFFDRSVVDAAGMPPRPIPAHVHRAAQLLRYHPTIFIAPPWPEIYAHDSERRQTLQEAEQTYQAMAKTYPAYGYQLIELPRTDVARRVQFVLDRVSRPRAQ